VLGFFIIYFLFRVGSWLDYLEEVYLRKVGWVFSPIWGFPKINSCVLLFMFMLLIFSVHDIVVKEKEDLSTLVILFLCK
jgi:hypothetical protein